MTDAKQQILDAADLVQVVSQTVALKRQGREYVGLCPFHNEKSPSFYVNPEKRVFLCRGCKAGGNVFDFVMKRDNVEFIDALKLLAERYNIDLPRYGVSKENASVKSKLVDAQSAAQKFFRRLFLTDSRGKPARDYMASRGFTDATLDTFKVGFAPDAWDAVLGAPEFKTFDAAMLQQAGLLKARENEGGFYDTFRGRVMFPIQDETGKTIAFGGRILPGSDAPAKYLNSPETPLFSKSKCAYGLYQARQKIVEKRTVAVVEGYTDVMMAHQYGVTNVVSVLGTALTEQHINLLRRFADKIVLLFDADTAGAGAADRSLELYLSQPIEIAVATLPEGKDPDEVLLEKGAAGFEQIIDSAQPALDYLWKRLAGEFMENESDLTGQQKAVEEFLKRMALARQSGMVDANRWLMVMGRVSKMTKVPTEELLRRVPKSGKGNMPVRRSGAPRTHATDQRSTMERVCGSIIGALLLEPSRWNSVQQSVSLRAFDQTPYARLAEVMWDHYRNEGAIPLAEFIDLLDDERKPLAVETASEAQEAGNLDRLIADALAYFAELRQRDDERQKISALKDGQAVDEDEVLRQLMAKKSDLRRS
jgi:DNA primase